MNKKGFTLIELLVVIAVLGILAAVVLVAINPTKRLQDARNAGVKSDMGQIGTAMESYYTENNGVYPTALTDLTAAGQQQLKQLPTAPAGRSTTACNPAPNGNYSYVVDNQGTIREEAAVYGELEPCDATEGAATKYYAYVTTCGKAGTITGATNLPTAANVPTYTCANLQ